MNNGYSEATIGVEALVAASESVNAPIRVMVVDPDSHTRTHFKNILWSTNDFSLTGEFDSANDAVNFVPGSRPDLVLFGVHRHHPISVRGISLFRHLVAGLRIIVVLCAGDIDLLEPSLRSGADACLVKPVRAAQCLATLRAWTRSRRTIPPEQRKAASELSVGADPKGCVSLSPREREVMSRLARGRLYKEIATEMGLSDSLVHKHGRNIFKKLNVHNRSEAIAVWFSEGAGGFVPVPSSVGEKPTTAPILP